MREQELRLDNETGLTLTEVRESILAAEAEHEGIDIAREAFLGQRGMHYEMRPAYMNVMDREKLCSDYSAWLQDVFMGHPSVSVDVEAIEQAVQRTLVGLSRTEVFTAEYGDISAFLRKDVESHLLFLTANNSQ